MTECVNWPVLLAVLGAAFSLFVIVLLGGWFLMRCLDARCRDNADRLPVLTKKELGTGLRDRAEMTKAVRSSIGLGQVLRANPLQNLFISLYGFLHLRDVIAERSDG